MLRRTIGLLLLSGFLTAGHAVAAATAQPSPSSNHEAVSTAFVRWGQGIGTPFDLLAEDATWTILGPSPTAGTYTIPRLRTEILIPFQSRLKTSLRPEVRAIHQDGDTVIALFEASARLKNGALYRNSYAWFFRFEDGAVRHVTAVLDLSAFDRVLALPE